MIASTTAVNAASSLTVTSSLPKGEVPSLTQITVRFSGNMHALGVMDDTAKTVPLKLTASGGAVPKGTFRWLDPTTLAYIFDGPVTTPVTINAVIPKGTTALDGSLLNKDVAWEVSTPPLKLELIKNELPQKKASITILSNYPLNTHVLRKKTSITLAGRKLEYTLKKAYHAEYAQGVPSKWGYTFTLKDNLPRNSTVAMNLAPGVTAKDGGLPAGKYAFTLPTYKVLRLESWQIGNERKTDEQHKNAPPQEALYLNFNNPVQLVDLLNHITVSPEPHKRDVNEYAHRSMRNEQALPYLWEPRTEYTVTLKPGVKDQFGTLLSKKHTFTFATGDYPPLLYMVDGAKVMETPLANLFPLFLRNTGKVTAQLRYVPWGPKAYHALRERDNATSDIFLQTTGTREAFAVLDVTDAPNRNLREMIDIPKALGFDSTRDVQGLVSVLLVKPEQDILDKNSDLASLYEYGNYAATLQVTDLSIIARMGARPGLAWVAGLSSGKPVAEAVVRLADKDGKTLWKGKTDKDGLAMLPGYADIPGEIHFCVATSGTDTSVLDMRANGVPMTAKAYAEQTKGNYPWRIHAVSQLPLYQPGQTVNTTVFAREFTANAKGETLEHPDWHAIADEKLNITVHDRQGRIVHTTEGMTNAYGSVPVAFTLSPNAEPGSYIVQATSERFSSQSASYPFTVASFRPPDFKVDLTAPASQPAPPAKLKPLQVDIHAGYFSGVLLPEGGVALAVDARTSWFTPKRLTGYKTGSGILPFGAPHHEQQMFSVQGKLDLEGNATLILPRIESKPGNPTVVSLTATVTDASKLTSQGTASFMLHPSEYYIGMRSPYMIVQKQTSTVELKAATWDNNPLTGKTVTLKAQRTTYIPLAEQGGEKQPKAVVETVWEKQVLLTSDLGDKVEVTFDKPGTYTLTAGITDSAGRENITTGRVYVPGAGMEWIRSQPGQYLEFLVEEKNYTPGDIAQVVVKNPFPTAVALVSIERGGVLRTMLREISGPAPLLDIPLTKEDAPYVYATITLLKSRTAPPPDMNAPDGTVDQGAPAMAHGRLLFKVSGVTKSLAVAVSTNTSEYRPGGEVTATATVTNASGTGEKSQVTFLAVDERILRVAGESTSWHPNRTFSELYPHSIYGANTLRSLLNRNVVIPNLHAGVGLASPQAHYSDSRPRMAPASPKQELGVQSIDGLVRGNFSPLAFWLAAGETDNAGKLTVTFSLPDSLTSYRIVAVTADKGSSFAVGETSVKASKPLQLLPTLPKFVTEGDTLHASILVQNVTAVPETVTVTAKASGARLDVKTREITLAAGKSGTVFFPLSVSPLAEGSGEVILEITGRMGEETDAARFAMTIKQALPMTTVAAAGLLKEGEKYLLPITVPGNLATRSKMALTFAPSPAAGIPLAAKQVLEYPWNCLEQRLSRAWARILRVEHGDFIGLAPDNTDREKIKVDMAGIAGLQNDDGSFSLWPSMSQNDNTLYLTAYALLVSSEAAPVGSPLPDNTIAKAVAFIEKALNNTPDKDKKYDDGAESSTEAFALALHVLALHKPEAARDIYPAVLAYCEESKTNPLGWGSLLMALDTINDLPGKTDIKTRIRINLEKTAAPTPTQMHFASVYDNGYWKTLGSLLRDNGMVLGSMSTAYPDYPRLEALARWVGQSVGDKKTLSTQEAVFGLWGLTKYLRSLDGGKETTLTALWNGRDEASFSFKRLTDAPEAWILPADKLNAGNSSLLELSTTSGTPYWTARLEYASVDFPAKEENAGFTITRNTSKPATGDKWKLGDVMDVTLTIKVLATRRHVLLFDPLPAGFEALYATRVDVADREKTWQPPWRWQDALDDGLLLYAPVIHQGTYVYKYSVRASASGTFTQRPSYVEEMYTPEVFGRTGADTVVVTAD